MKVTPPKISIINPLSNQKFREAQAVFVMKHNHSLNLEAVRNTTENIEKSSSNKWLFLVEGYKQYSCQENLYLDDLVDQLGVQTEDPIHPPFTQEIAQTASVDPYSAALSVFVIDFLDLLNMHNIAVMDGEFLEEVINNALESTSKTFGVEAKVLKKRFEELDWKNEEKLSKQILELADIRKALIGRSNNLSRVKLDRILDLNPQPHVFIMSGIEHEPVFIE